MDDRGRQDTLQLIRAEYVITDPDRLAEGVVRDGAVVISGGEVVTAGEWGALKQAYGQLEAVGGPNNWLVMPGLVNAHHHGRGIGTVAGGMPDAHLELWLPTFMLYPRFDTYWNTLYAAVKMIRGGVTCSIHSHSGGGPPDVYRRNVEDALAAYRDAGVRVTFAMGLYDQQYLAYTDDQAFIAGLPPELQRAYRRWFPAGLIYLPPEAYFALFAELQAKCGDEYPLATLGLSPTGLHWASDALLQRMADVARQQKAIVHSHLLETMYQRRYAWRRFGVSAVAALERFGLLGPHVSLAHAIWCVEEDLARLAASGATLVTNASSNLRLGSGLAPVAVWLEKGVHAAMGLDSTTLFGDDDMFKEMRLVSVLHRRPGHNNRWPSAYEVLRMATTGGARAAGLEGRVGRLLPGYRADITVLDLSRIRRPYLDIGSDEVEQALAGAQMSDVDTVLVEGKVLLSGGRLVHLDREVIEAKLAEQGERAGGEARAFLEQLEPYLRALYRGWEPETHAPYYLLHSRE